MKIPTLAIVVPCYNEGEVVRDTSLRLLARLKALQDAGKISTESFICFVDDGSSDDTWKVVCRLAADHRAVRGAKLSRNFGHQSALLAGLTLVKDRCDCAISIDADLQQDEAAIPLFVEAFRQGNDVVFGVRRDRAADGPFKRLTASGFYRLMSWMGAGTVEHHADYRLLSRRALEALDEYQEGNIFLRGVVTQLGFRSAVVPFEVTARRAGQTKYSTRRMLSFALNGITAFSIAPLRLIAFLGAVFTLFSMAMAAYVVVSKLLFAAAVPGWASTVLPIYILGGIQLFAIGVMGEYIGRIYLETKRRPRFIVEEDRTA